ncbi:E3 ubiquitin-protein ligase RNF26-like [Populus alba x Populus x berolinensis]|nr:E3 ubiquitin-protein ligase RNF26-like [Populus alba x Populus x berolinensis]
MNSLDGITMTGWKNLKQRLSFKGLGGCCGSTSWSSRSETPSMPFIDMEEEEDEESAIMQNQAQGGGFAAAPGAGMNLAMALAAERNSRASNVKTLMRLIEETDGVDWRTKNKTSKSRRDKEQEQGPENDWVCCVCMERKKGAAFIPCGHAFCRVCSREMWVNRGSCPICNRSILDILDIF